MSTGVRRFNYTKRQRLKRQHLQISQSQRSDDSPLVISAELDLSPYNLPADGRVFVEAYRSAAWQRFDYGTVRTIAPPADCELHDFGTGAGLLFRVKIVEPESDDTVAGRILAQADSIPANQEGRPQSILALDTDPDMRDEVWRLDFGDDDWPRISVSGHLVADRLSFARSPAFLSLVMPEALRRILHWSLENGLPEEDDWHRPRGVWIRFACSLLKQMEPPAELGDEDSGADKRDEWVDEAVTRFCRINHIDRTFSQWWKGAGSSSRGGN